MFVDGNKPPMYTIWHNEVLISLESEKKGVLTINKYPMCNLSFMINENKYKIQNLLCD